jgi:hypothetical protein
MDVRQSLVNSLTTTQNVQTQPTNTPNSTNGTLPVRSTLSFTVRTQPVIRLSPNFTVTTVTTATSVLYVHSTTPPVSLSYTALPTATQTMSPSTTPTQGPPYISSSAAMGIGVAAGVVGLVILQTAALFIFRCWKVRRSPAVRYYEQARQWKGFTPATPSTARTTLIGSKMANIYFTDIRSPATPPFTLSPPMEEVRTDWPLTPANQKCSFTELSV